MSSAPRPVAEQHQPFHLGAIGVRQVRQARIVSRCTRVTPGPKMRCSSTSIRIQRFGVEDCRHRVHRFLSVGMQSCGRGPALAQPGVPQAGCIGKSRAISDERCRKPGAYPAGMQAWTRASANPGTSEMHFVAALDRIPGMRCVLCLFEGVVTGAADGYARMTDRNPAATLLHCGPGIGERPGQPAQCPARPHPDREHRGRPGDLPPPAGPAADGGHRGVGRVRCPAGCAPCTSRTAGRRGRSRRGAGGPLGAGSGRDPDPAIGHQLG